MFLLICQKEYLPPLFYRINSCRVLVSFKTILRCCWFLNYYAKKKNHIEHVLIFSIANYPNRHSEMSPFIIHHRITMSSSRSRYRTTSYIIVCCLLFLHCDFVCFDFICTYCVFFCFYFILKSATSIRHLRNLFNRTEELH